jgi:hypothetical protein
VRPGRCESATWLATEDQFSPCLQTWSRLAGWPPLQGWYRAAGLSEVTLTSPKRTGHLEVVVDYNDSGIASATGDVRVCQFRATIPVHCPRAAIDSAQLIEKAYLARVFGL